MTLRRDWTLAIGKCHDEPCRNCGNTRGTECAHIAGRVYDRQPALRPIEHSPLQILVHPDRVIPLCGPVSDHNSCHGAQHARRLDILKLLTPQEQLQAVADLGGIESARIRLCPSAYPERLAA